MNRCIECQTKDAERDDPRVPSATLVGAGNRLCLGCFINASLERIEEVTLDEITNLYVEIGIARAILRNRKAEIVNDPSTSR